MEDAGRSQFANPSGDEGRRFLENMNEHHATLWDWCLEHMPKSADGSVLDVGCGGGGFIRRLAETYPYASFTGMDISETALQMTSENNRELQEAGGLTLVEASVDDMPFEDGSFDMVTAMETYFFWPDLERSLEEIRRVLSEGGILAIGSEMRLTDRTREEMEKAQREIGMRLVDDETMMRLLYDAGFEARMFAAENGRWALYLGYKP